MADSTDHRKAVDKAIKQAVKLSDQQAINRLIAFGGLSQQEQEQFKGSS